MDSSKRRVTARHRTFHAELLAALAEPGCAFCRLGARTVARYLDILNYENVNDVALRGVIREALGLCNRHAWQFVDGTRAPLGSGIIYRDLIRTLQQRTSDSLDPTADTLRRLRGLVPRGECVACGALATMIRDCAHQLHQSWSDHAFRDAFAASDGLCWTHLLAALDADRLARTWGGLLAAQRAAWERRIDRAQQQGRSDLLWEALSSAPRMNGTQLSPTASAVPPSDGVTDLTLPDVPAGHCAVCAGVGEWINLTPCPSPGAPGEGRTAPTPAPPPPRGEGDKGEGDAASASAFAAPSSERGTSSASPSGIGRLRAGEGVAETPDGDEDSGERDSLTLTLSQGEREPASPHPNPLPEGGGIGRVTRAIRENLVGGGSVAARLCAVHAWYARRARPVEESMALADQMWGLLDHLDRAVALDTSGPALLRWAERMRRGSGVPPGSDDGAGCPVCAAQLTVEAVLVAQVGVGTLCVPHLRVAAQQGPDFNTRRETTRQTWHEVEGQLDEFIRKHDYRFQREPRGVEQGSYRWAIELVAGVEGVR